MTYHAVGAVADVGRSPYKVDGNPVIALVAQINRFADKTVRTGDAGRVGCGNRKLLTSALPLVAALDPRGATAAALIVWTRYSCAPLGTASTSKEKWAAAGLFGDSWSFVMNNLSEITITLAQYADSLGLEPATVGITQVDPKMKPRFPTVTAVLLGALALGVVMISRRAR